MNRTVKQGIDNCYMVHKHEHPGYEENRCAVLRTLKGDGEPCESRERKWKKPRTVGRCRLLISRRCCHDTRRIATGTDRTDEIGIMRKNMSEIKLGFNGLRR